MAGVSGEDGNTKEISGYTAYGIEIQEQIIRALLDKKGTPIGEYDLMIAAHALSLGLTLVTNNTKEFKRVPNLQIDNWV